MKNKALILGSLILGVTTASPLFALTALKFTPGGGGVWAIGDQIEESEIGYSVSGTIEAEVWKGFDYGFKYYYSNVTAMVPNTFTSDTADTSLDVAFQHHVFQLTNTWSPGWRWVDPYIRGAVGLYSWKELYADTLLRATIINTSTNDTTYNDLKATSFGISLGGGLRIWPTEYVGLRLGVDYDLVFSENRDKFGTFDANENLLRVGGEVVFRIPLNK